MLPPPLNCVLGFGGAICIWFVGRYFVRSPEKIYRVFSIGQEPSRFGVGFFRTVGWFYIVFASVGALMFFVLTILSLIHSH